MNSRARDVENGRGYRPASPSNSSIYSTSSRRSSGSGSSARGGFRAHHFANRPTSVHSFRNNGKSPYSASAEPHKRQLSINSSIADQYSLAPDPKEWGTALTPSYREDDDMLHMPDPVRDKQRDSGGSFFTNRGLLNLGCMAILAVGLVGLFAAYPLISYFSSPNHSFLGAFNVGGINASGQVADMKGNWGLIDLDTPKDAYTYIAPTNNNEMELVFSDEFNQDGRSFYPGDDPYWEAVDLHYWQTNNLEWYDPAAITTSNGSLEVTLSRKKNHDLNFQGGMMSTWNKFCFTGGAFLASVQLPGAHNVAGLWPAVWAMGNLGRAGYGASLEGMWPYTYDSCDVGTVKNQTIKGQPPAGRFNDKDDALSFLPGQRLSACTCQNTPSTDHPGPKRTDGTFVGRAAPEIDVIEAQVQNNIGAVSQSGQFGPFDDNYRWKNTTDGFVIFDDTVTEVNSFLGGQFQEATSCVTQTNVKCYQLGAGCFSVYGFEYKPGFDDAYITWISDNKKAWTLFAEGVGKNDKVQIGARAIPQEPMYLILNLGMSFNFGDVDFEHLIFPATMRIDWIRVYQEKGKKNIGCDPPDFPTKAYIDRYLEAYTNPNLTTWVDDFHQKFPKNKLIDQC